MKEKYSFSLRFSDIRRYTHQCIINKQLSISPFPYAEYILYSQLDCNVIITVDKKENIIFQHFILHTLGRI